MSAVLQQPDQDEYVLVKRARIAALSRALGNPTTVNALEGDTVEDCLVEIAAKRLTYSPIREVVATSITHNGAHVGNVFTDRDHAYVRMRTLNRNHPDDRRELVDLVPAGSFDMLQHLERQRAFSERTFGPGMRTQGVIDHIRKELIEIEAAPTDLSEWIDVAILALDGAWRTGATPQQIIEALLAKQAKNEARQWPDWRTVPAGQAIEHVRTGDVLVDQFARAWSGPQASPELSAHPLPWSAKIETHAIGDTGDYDSSVVINDANGKCIAQVFCDEGIDQAVANRIVSSVNATQPTAVPQALQGVPREQESSDPIVGHKTFRNEDGSTRHEPLYESESKALLDSFEEAKQLRAKLMPTEQDAASAMWQAWYRLKELGWRETSYGPTNVQVQLIEPGSSGIHRGTRWNDWPEKTWWIDSEWPSTPCLFKPIPDEAPR